MVFDGIGEVGSPVGGRRHAIDSSTSSEPHNVFIPLLHNHFKRQHLLMISVFCVSDKGRQTNRIIYLPPLLSVLLACLIVCHCNHKISFDERAWGWHSKGHWLNGAPLEPPLHLPTHL